MEVRGGIGEIRAFAALRRNQRRSSVSANQGTESVSVRKNGQNSGSHWRILQEATSGPNNDPEEKKLIIYWKVE